MNQSLLYPYAPLDRRNHRRVVDAKGTRLYFEDGSVLIDGISSWWSVIHGYCHPEIDAALTEQISRFSHVMLGGLTHHPAEALAEKIKQLAPGDLDYVFFSDSGSVAVEVALKFALQYFRSIGEARKRKFVSFRRGYHGDTFGAISVGDPCDGMHADFASIFDNFFLGPPNFGFEASDEDLERAVNELRGVLEPHHDEIAAFICEPVMQGAGGMNTYDPRFLKAARTLCDEFDALMIFDEVATGFGRLGDWFAANLADTVPDIMVLGKALTAGYLGHAATVINQRVYDRFVETNEPFLHGPTFMGNPLACSVALKSIEIFEREAYLDQVAGITSLLQQWASSVRGSNVKEVRILGAMGVVELNQEIPPARVQQACDEHGVWLRPIGRYLYTMPALNILHEDLRRILHAMTALASE